MTASTIFKDGDCQMEFYLNDNKEVYFSLGHIENEFPDSLILGKNEVNILIQKLQEFKEEMI